MSGAPLTLGTAGHIDHGKTALIRALTGTDTDRLPEERARGISIELGYARLSLPSGRHLSVIDVPGHERFLRTMVAGATGVDLFLMTIAADDGVMPQTREHAVVLEALGLSSGVVAVTKADLADPHRAVVQAAELLPQARVVVTSTRTGSGLQELCAVIDSVAADLPGRGQTPAPARLHVDRVFTIRGAGTVVTGTLWSGRLSRADEVQLLPSGRSTRIRGVQVHDQAVPSALAGQRVAVNLTGVAVAEVQRGDVLVSAQTAIRPTYLIDAELFFAGPRPEHGHRVHVHHGTRESPARLAWLGGAFWQLRLEQPLVPVAGDRVVIRQIAPPDTLGGGVVLDAQPGKHGPSRELLARLERTSRREEAGEADEIGQAGEADEDPGDGDQTGEAGAAGKTPPARSAAAGAVSLPPSALAAGRRLREAGLEPPLDSEFDPTDLAALRAAGQAVRVAKALHYHPAVLADVRGRLVALAERHQGAITLAQLRDELGTSRKFAQALLEHFDSEKVTLRRGDEHILRRFRAER